MKHFLTFIFFLLLPNIAGFIGAYFTFPAISSWYQYLNKPFFSPPNWLFGPVWTILYLLMGIASFLVSQSKNPNTSKILKIYFFHLVLNSLWSILFFGLRNPLLAFLAIIVLWAMILYLIINFYKIKKAAGILFLPYLFWVSFASVLNLFIVLLN